MGIVLFGLTVRGRAGNFDSVESALALKNHAGPLEAHHEQSPYAEFLRLKNNGTILLDRSHAALAAPDVGFIPDENKYYSFYLSGITHLIVPLYWVGYALGLAQVFAYFTISLIAIATMILIYITGIRVWKFSNNEALLAAITFGFATFAWSYSITIYQHMPTTLLAVVMFLSAYEYKKSKRSRWLVLTGGAYGISSFFDYPNLIILSPYVVYAFINTISLHSKSGKHYLSVRPAAAWMALTILTIGAIHGARNAYYFGNPTMYANLLPRYSLDPELTAAWMKIKFITPIFQESYIPYGMVLYFLLPEKAFWIFSPILLMSFLGIYLVRKHMDAKHKLHIALCVFTALFYMSFFDAAGGFAFGPRYLIPILPSMCYFAVMAISSSFSHLKLRKGFYYVLFAISSFIATLGAVTTNMIPTSLDAQYYNKPFSTYALNWQVMLHGESSTFIYHELVRPYMSMATYILMLWLAVLVSITFILYPNFYKKLKLNR